MDEAHEPSCEVYKSYHYIKYTKDNPMILEIDVWMDKSYKFNYRK